MFKLLSLIAAWRRLKGADTARKSMPGEHLLTAGVGMWLLSSAKKKPFLARNITRAIGLALLARSASGRDGLARFKR